MIYTFPGYDNSTDTSPTTLLFKWDNDGIYTFFLGKTLGRPEKTTLLFLLFFRKKRPLKKHPFSELVEISKIENRKKAKNHWLEAPDPKIILGELSVNKHGIARNFGWRRPGYDFIPFFRKNSFGATHFPDFSCNLPRKLLKSRILR